MKKRIPNWDKQDRDAREWARRDAHTFAMQPSPAARCAWLMDSHRFVVCGVFSWEHASWSDQ